MQELETDAAELLERLRTPGVLGDAPQKELEWLVQHGRYRLIDQGEVLVAASEAVAEGFHVVLSGRIAMYVTRHGERRKAMEWLPGDVTGLLPYSRMKTSPGDTVAEEPSELLTIAKEDFAELAGHCQEITARMVHVMIDRARTFTTADLHDEKMASLGRMAAGLAHELNNPASAVASGARSLVERLTEAENASRELGAAGLSREQLDAVDQVRSACHVSVTNIRSPIAQSDYEEQIADWLEEHGADVDAAAALAEGDVGLDTLNGLALSLEGQALDAALRWIAAVSGSRGLALDIESAASRIHDLVRAVQGFTDMDRAMVAQSVDVQQGLETTVRVLRVRAKEKSASVSVEVEPDLPRVHAYGGELNQVWVNLVANAIDAIDEEGAVEVRARRDGGSLLVRVIDDGPGIPAEVRPHIFEPFFTTKKVGEGTGLGLDIVRRLIQRNDGEIEVHSIPGRTEFRVYLKIPE